MIQRTEYFFYAEYGLIVSTQSDWLQWSFGILTAMFDWVVLWEILVRQWVWYSIPAASSTGTPMRIMDDG